MNLLPLLILLMTTPEATSDHVSPAIASPERKPTTPDGMIWIEGGSFQMGGVGERPLSCPIAARVPLRLPPGSSRTTHYGSLPAL